MINPDLYNDKLVNQCVAHSGRPHNDKIIISVTKHDRILSAPYSTCNKLICSSSLKTSARSEVSFQYLNTCFGTKYGLTNMLHMCTFTLTSMFCDTLQKLVTPYQLLTYHYTMQMANKFLSFLSLHPQNSVKLHLLHEISQAMLDKTLYRHHICI